MLTEFTMAFGHFSTKGFGRAVRFVRGLRYRLQPIGAREVEKSRRTGVIENFEETTPPECAFVRFDDTGEIEKVPLVDLVQDRSQP
ncbi:MAG: hypothetical protein HY000_00325 [Planctomycetes bacterium]|nr:hypothetical protein [Planctomycetota bacterium]